jgi:hypothetical protein
MTLAMYVLVTAIIVLVTATTAPVIVTMHVPVTAIIVMNKLKLT